MINNNPIIRENENSRVEIFTDKGVLTTPYGFVRIKAWTISNQEINLGSVKNPNKEIQRFRIVTDGVNEDLPEVVL